MQTQLADFIRGSAQGDEADAILRSCVHCGFCTATCPTYQLLGDELDGPRGRIYLIKEVLEGQPVTGKTQQHLDRCLTCRSCETTCPSGVNYHRLLDIGREVVDQRVKRPLGQRLWRGLLLQVLPRRVLFAALLTIGQTLRPVLPQVIRQKIPVKTPLRSRLRPEKRHARRVLMLEGCVQPALSPNINAATARVLDAIGLSIESAPAAGCCGALRFHLNEQAAALNDMRANIDAWWPLLANGAAEALVMTASGCGVQVNAYGELLASDESYRDKAELVAARTLDISELLALEENALLEKLAARARDRGLVAFHSPCTLQHGQKIRGTIERFLIAAGYRLTPVADAHLCCGSAGTYSLLEPKISLQLRDNKIAALLSGAAISKENTALFTIASANIGCLTHLQAGTQAPVRHWIELLDEAINH